MRTDRGGETVPRIVVDRPKRIRRGDSDSDRRGTTLKATAGERSPAASARTRPEPGTGTAAAKPPAASVTVAATAVHTSPGPVWYCRLTTWPAGLLPSPRRRVPVTSTAPSG